MKVHPALALLADLAGAMSCSSPSREASSLPTHRLLPVGPGVSADFALMIESRENMGCLVGQRISAESPPDLTGGFTLSSGAGGEDASTLREFYLGFASEPDSKRTGFLVFRLWVEPAASGEPASLLVSSPRLERKAVGKELSLAVSGSGTLRIALMWASGKALETVWRTCPEADVQEPFQGTFLVAQNLDAPLVPGDRFPLESTPKAIQVGIDPAGQEFVARAARGMALLEGMAESFGSAESRWVWHGARMTGASLSAEVKKAGPAQIAVRFDDGRTIGTTNENFDAPIRWRITVLDEYGKRKGAEVRIAPE